MVKNIILILSIILLNSCSYENSSLVYINNFTYCYDNKPTGLDTVINLQGYYSSMNIKKTILYHKNNEEVIDTIYYNDMFFKNGICVRNFFQSSVEENLTTFERMAFYNGYKWGNYRIVNDTIKAQYIYKPIRYSVNDSWDGYEIWYKILNSKSIKEINLIPLEDFKSKDDSIIFYNIYKTRVNKQAPYNFVPTKIIPSPDSSWILKEPWFWCK